MPGIRSAYRAVKERIKGPSVLKEMFVLDTLQDQLDSDWKTAVKEGLQSDPVLVRQKAKAQAFLTAGNAKDAGPAIQELRRLIPDVKAAREIAALEAERRAVESKRSALLNQFREQHADRADGQESASNEQRATQRQNAGENQPDVEWDPRSALGQALTQEAAGNAEVLQQTAERPPPNPAPNRPQKQLESVQLDEREVTVGDKTFMKQITVGNKKYGNPEYINSGSFGAVAKYTSDKGQAIAVKVVAINDELKNEFEINQQLLDGDENARGRDNVMLMKGFVEDTRKGKAYIVMDCAAGDLNDTKHAMNALSESGALPEEARSVLNQYMMKQALEGVKYLRDQNVTHFDLKELNTFIMPDGTVKVADFGGSGVGVQGGSQEDRVGTEVYMPLEVHDRMGGKYAAPDDPTKIDTHSLGRMLDSLHTGDNMPHVGQGGKAWGANPELTGALSDVNEAMTQDAAQQRPTLEAALDASYFRNLDNYDPQAIKDLIAATVSYSSSLKGKKVDGQGYKKLSEDLHEKRQKLAEFEKTMKPGQEVIQSLEQEIIALDQEIRAGENAEKRVPNIFRLKETLQKKQREVEAERAKEQQISTQDQSLGNQIKALQATLKPIQEEVQTLKTELKSLETSEPRDDNAIAAKKQELQDKQSELQENRKPLDALLKPWNDKRQELQKAENDLQKLNEDPAVKPHLDKIRELSQRLQSGK